jgi:preprotein translocase subunit SecA
MIQSFARKLFGTQNDRELKSIAPLIVQANSFEQAIKKLTDEQLKAKTQEFRERLAKGTTLDDLLPEAFAVVREASVRVLGMRHYDVQLIGGATLHRGRIAEMKTGEGKTLVATLPCYLNALSGKGVHVITVNDYLAKRDSQMMGQVYSFLGLTTGIIVHGLTDAERKVSYACDITYGTNNEFGFDYLRDNMKFRLEDYVQRPLNYAIVDEVDSILIDEARTPLIISGPSDNSSDLYYLIDRKISEDGGLTKDVDFTIDEKSKTAALTLEGVDKMEKRLNIKNLYDPTHIEVLHHVNQALRAHKLYTRDVDYVVRDGEVMIVDEFTGRLMPGRRWSDGLHQAIEAKENVKIEAENQTLATITFQNYFRMYSKLSGMTGTADTEATEFKQIYKLDVTVIPTNKQMIRKDQADVIYKTEAAKFQAIIAEIKQLQEKGQPVLVGTVSVEKSEVLASLLKKEGIKHNVLNAKQHEREAEIVAQAGRKGSVTISTNMAGRGTDILLGGNPEFLAKNEVGTLKEEATEEERLEHEKKLEEASKRWKALCADERRHVVESGGLFILGTERHESRRIDNQLRGRAGRQGDPGESRFYLSLEDNLMRIFGGQNIAKYMEEDLPIEHKWITKAIENAQRKVEAHNYDIRKHLLEYDDVMNQQRKVVYAWRREVLSQEELRTMVFSMVEEIAGQISNDIFPNGKLKRENGQQFFDKKVLEDALKITFGTDRVIEERDVSPFTQDGLRRKIAELAESVYAAKEKEMTPEVLRQIEKMILLTTIDHLWKDHLLAMDHMRDGIGLQGYGQKDPLIEYKKQGFKFFEIMMGMITGDVVRKLFAVQIAPEEHRDWQDFGGTEPAHLDMEPTLPQSEIQYNIDAEGNLVPIGGAAVAPLPVAGPSRAQAASNKVDQALQARAPQRMQMGRGPLRSTDASFGSGEEMDLLSAGPGGGSMGGGMRSQSHASAAAPQVPKAGRNDPCPCGSGKKYKKCHGVND